MDVYLQISLNALFILEFLLICIREEEVLDMLKTVLYFNGNYTN